MKKIALVTGASAGMGKEFVMQLADRFDGIEEIWVIARRKQRLDELIAQVPVVLRIFEIDLLKKEEWCQLKTALEDQKPDVKILINSAGYGKIGKVGSLSIEDEIGMIELNNTALCAVTHMVLPYMSRNSRIIQFASSAAFLPQPQFAIYAATKSFVLSYSRALNSELKERDIFVTAVCPGPVKTEFFDVAETTGKIPLYKHFVMADKKLVVALALKDSMMGKTVSVYGGVMKVFYVVSKLLPHELMLRMMELINV